LGSCRREIKRSCLAQAVAPVVDQRSTRNKSKTGGE
jgi:hypothetical protein